MDLNNAYNAVLMAFGGKKMQEVMDRLQYMKLVRSMEWKLM